MKASLQVAQRSETEIFEVCLIISVFNMSLHDAVYKFLKMMKTLHISTGCGNSENKQRSELPG